MKNVLAVTIAIMLAAAILSPAVGFTFQSGGNQSYSIGSTKVNYTISMGMPAQNLTLGMIPAANAPSAAVKVTSVKYSFKLGGAKAYSFKLTTNTSLTSEGLKAIPNVLALGSIANK